MHFPVFYVFAFTLFVTCCLTETNDHLTEIKIIYDRASENWQDSLSSNSNTLVVPLDMLDTLPKADKFLEYAQRLYDEFEINRIPNCIFKKTSSFDQPTTNFLKFIPVVSDSIMKFQELLYSYKNKKKGSNLRKQSEVVEKFINHELSTLEHLALSSRYPKPWLSCFATNLRLANSVRQMYLLSKLKTFVLMMVIESAKPLLFETFPSLSPKQENEEKGLPLFQTDFFFLLQGLKLKDISFMKNAPPHPALVDSKQYLVFPIDILTNILSFSSSLKFLNTFFINTGMFRLSENLKELSSSNQVSNSFQKIKQKLNPCIREVYKKLKELQNGSKQTEISILELCGEGFQKEVTESQEFNIYTSFVSNHDDKKPNSFLGSAFSENIPILLMADAVLKMVKEQLPSSTILPSSRVEALSSDVHINENESGNDKFIQTPSIDKKVDASITSINNRVSSEASKLGSNGKSVIDASFQTRGSIRKRKNKNQPQTHSFSTDSKRKKNHSTAKQIDDTDFDWVSNFDLGHFDPVTSNRAPNVETVEDTDFDWVSNFDLGHFDPVTSNRAPNMETVEESPFNSMGFHPTPTLGLKTVDFGPTIQLDKLSETNSHLKNAHNENWVENNEPSISASLHADLHRFP